MPSAARERSERRRAKGLTIEKPRFFDGVKTPHMREAFEVVLSVGSDQAAAGLGWLRTCIFCQRMTSTTRPMPMRSVMAAG